MKRAIQIVGRLFFNGTVSRRYSRHAAMALRSISSCETGSPLISAGTSPWLAISDARVRAVKAPRLKPKM
ncbi:hypothetical protein ACVWW4_006003 [Bradyrhizobium sp. LB7.1]